MNPLFLIGGVAAASYMLNESSPSTAKADNRDQGLTNQDSSDPLPWDSIIKGTIAVVAAGAVLKSFGGRQLPDTFDRAGRSEGALAFRELSAKVPSMSRITELEQVYEANQQKYAPSITSVFEEVAAARDAASQARWVAEQESDRLWRQRLELAEIEKQREYKRQADIREAQYQMREAVKQAKPMSYKEYQVSSFDSKKPTTTASASGITGKTSSQKLDSSGPTQKIQRIVLKRG